MPDMKVIERLILSWCRIIYQENQIKENLVHMYRKQHSGTCTKTITDLLECEALSNEFALATLAGSPSRMKALLAQGNYASEDLSEFSVQPLGWWSKNYQCLYIRPIRM